MIRISNIRVSIDDNTDIKEKAAEIIGKKHKIKSFRISKKSIDARKKNNILYVYSADVETDNEEELVKRLKNVKEVDKQPYRFPDGKKLEKPVVIVGTGPAGLMCALTLAENGHKIILVERGKKVDDRVEDVNRFWESGKLNPESNVQFGEGGAGTFSDGKLTTGINDFRIEKVLNDFYANGAPEEILYQSKPHIGTDKLCDMVASIRRKIISLGGKVRFSSKLTDIKISNGKVTAAVIEDEDGEYIEETDNIVLAIGHSARDTFQMLKENNVKMEKKSFSVGARIEHSQEMINKSQYGEFYNRLPAADYKMAVHLDNGRGVYTFCMCPGGTVVASASEEGGVVTNGMSYFSRGGKNSNSAILVNITPDDFISEDPLSGMYFQREIEEKAFKEAGGNYSAPCQSVASFLKMQDNGEKKVETTYRPGVTETDLDKVLPSFVADSLREGIIKMDSKLHGFASGDAMITAPETRSSSPVRIIRDKDTFQANIKGLYPCGEGAGYAGGIMSAAVDGIKVAEKIVLNAK